MMLNRPVRRVRPLLGMGILGAALALAACGGGGGDDGDGNGEAGGTGAAVADEARQLFADKGCAECHGAEGEGNGSPRTELAGTRLIIQQFQTRVRNGRGSAMPAYGTEQITDEEIRTLWEWLRTQ